MTTTTARRGLIARALYEGPIAEAISAWVTEASESIAMAKLEAQVSQLERRAKRISERAAKREALIARLGELSN